MKTLLCTLLLLNVAVGLSLPVHARELSGQGWMETYYLDPQPDSVPGGIAKLIREGYLDRPDNTATAIGFLATLFARHPEDVSGWLERLPELTRQQQRLLASALWQAGHPLGPAVLEYLGQNSPWREAVQQLARMPAQPVADTPVRSLSSMRLQWGAFLASGDERHILAILDAFGRNEPDLSSATRRALAVHAAQHPRVLAICESQLARQPEEIRNEVRAALEQAGATLRY